MKIKIDERIKNRLMKLDDTEYNLLEKSILEEGLREPLMLWEYNNEFILIDGHHRYEICKKHNIYGKTITKTFNDIEEVLSWIDINQLSRRNLTDKQRDIVFGRIYSNVKQQHGGDRASGQNDHLQKTSQLIADKFNVSEVTIRRAEKFYDSMEEIKRNMGQEVYDNILTEKIKLNKNEINDLSKMNAFDMEKTFDKLKDSNSLKEAKKKIEIDIRKETIMEFDSNLYNGDAVEILKTFKDNSVDMVLTDPPYGISYIDTRNSFNPDYKDDENYAIELLERVAIELKRITKPGSHLYFFSGYSNAFKFQQILSKYFLVQENWITWVKNNHTMTDFDKNWAYKYEIIWFCKNENDSRKLNYSVSPDVLEYPIPTNKKHSAQKPIELLKYIIGNSSLEGEVILDPFMGSGTTPLSAKLMNRKYIGIELEEDIYKIANEMVKS